MKPAAHETSTLHLVLTKPVILERVPWWGTLVLIIGLAALTGLPWPDPLAVTGFYFVISLVDWGSLLLLPRMKRSYGPVNPPLFVLTVLRVVLSLLIGWVSGWSRGALLVVIIVQLVILAVATYGLWIEPFQLGVTEEHMTSPKLDPDQPPIRLLHLADLHMEYRSIREDRLQALVEQLAPDIIVFSGDFISLSYPDNPEIIAAIRDCVGAWQAPYGVYAVSGTPSVESHDQIAEFIKGTQVRWLRDEVVEVEVHGQRLALIGVTCVHNPVDDAARMAAIARQVPDDCFQLLLIHAPDIAPEAAQAGTDLYLCGHTHGGQWRIPGYGAVITSSVHGKRFEMGRYPVDDMTLYVSRGIGLEGCAAPRSRIFCPPEIIMWTLSSR